MIVQYGHHSGCRQKFIMTPKLRPNLLFNCYKKVESTIGFFVKQEGLIGSKEVSKAAGDDKKHD